jgi:hypothetical protein
MRSVDRDAGLWAGKMAQNLHTDLWHEGLVDFGLIRRYTHARIFPWLGRSTHAIAKSCNCFRFHDLIAPLRENASAFTFGSGNHGKHIQFAAFLSGIIAPQSSERSRQLSVH